MAKPLTKKKYSNKDYRKVAERIFEAWSEPTSPPSVREITSDLKKSKRRMDEEYSFMVDMES